MAQYRYGTKAYAHRLRRWTYGSSLHVTRVNRNNQITGNSQKGGFYGILDFYAAYGFDNSTYNDWLWKIFYEKYSKRNQCGIWIPDFHVYEK